MQKLKAQFKFPLNVNCNSPQGIAHKAATPETHPHLFGETLLCVIENRLFKKNPKHYTGVINQRAAGGKWEEVELNPGLSIQSYLERIGAVKAEFRGTPRITTQ